MIYKDETINFASRKDSGPPKHNSRDFQLHTIQLTANKYYTVAYR